MQKNCLQLLSLIFIIFFSAGCNKEIDEPASISKQVSNDSRSERRNDNCRLTREESTYALVTYKYNRKGLVDELQADYMGGGLFKHEYKSGRLIKSRFIINNQNTFTIYFYYNKFDKVNHEIWYDGDGSTKTMIDEVFYLFNKKGLAIKMYSDLLDYYTDFTYDRNGSLIVFAFYLQGQINAIGEYTYYRRLKNPSSAVPGFEYDYTSAIGVYSRNKWYSTSQKITIWENGIAAVVSDQDPKKTIMEGNEQNYAIHAEYFERTGEQIIFDFTYDNCGSCKPHERNDRSANKISAGADKKSATFQMKKLLKPLLRKPK